MSKIAFQPNVSGTGTFTLAAPDSNTDRTLTLPDAAGEVLTDQSDLSAANLTGDVAAARITTALNATGSAPVYACRAWVNFDGRITSGNIRASGNVSSVTRNSTARYTVNFSTAMPNSNYIIVGSVKSGTGSGFAVSSRSADLKTVSSYRLRTPSIAAGNFNVNPDEIYVAAFR